MFIVCSHFRTINSTHTRSHIKFDLFKITIFVQQLLYRNMQLGSFKRSIGDMRPVDENDIERLDKILSGELTFPSVPVRDINQTLIQRPLPLPPQSKRRAQRWKNSKVRITHSIVPCEDVSRHQGATRRYTTAQLGHDAHKDSADE